MQCEEIEQLLKILTITCIFFLAVNTNATTYSVNMGFL